METEVNEDTVISHDEQSLLEPQQTKDHLHLLLQQIAAMPAVDTNKVQAILQKLKNNELAILGTGEEQLACAQRIAQQIIDETLQKPKS